MKEFHISDILSITTERLVSTRHMNGIYDILNYMTGDNLFTHQLPRAARECKPFLIEQYPQLKEVNSDKVNTDNWEEWLDEQIKIFGEKLFIEPLPSNVHKFIDPITEIIEMKNN